MMTNDGSGLSDAEQPFISHLIELRTRLIKSLLVVAVVFAVLSFWANDVYAYLAGPLTRHMPSGAHMIAIGVASPFLAPLKLSLVVSFFLAIPFVLYQIWAFIAPGLYQHEKRLALPLLVASILLFYCGMAFAYFVVLPIIFQFMITTAPPGVAVMTDINQYMDFVLTLFMAFGVSFEVPIATILAVASGLISRASIADKRPYAILGAFIIGAVLTPPDVISQTLLAVPIWLLFELGLFFSRFFKSRGEPELIEG